MPEEILSSPRLAQIRSQLHEIFKHLLGVNVENVDENASFIELGADSLLLLQVSQSLQKKMNVKIPFRSLIEEFTSPLELALHLDEIMPPDAFAEAIEASPEEVAAPEAPAAPIADVPAPAAPAPPPVTAEVVPTPPPQVVAAPQPMASTMVPVAPRPLPFVQPAAPTVEAHPISWATMDPPQPADGSVASILDQQLRIMNQQLQVTSEQLGLLAHSPLPQGAWTMDAQPVAHTGNGQSTTTPQEAPAPQPEAPANTPAPAATAPASAPASPSTSAPKAANGSGSGASQQPATKSSEKSKPAPYRAYRPPQVKKTGFTETQEKHLADLVARLDSKMAKSKALTQRYRQVLADNRAAVAFRLPLKELQYPIFVDRGEGARVWDIDGNESVDVTMGFGTLILGHSPPFVFEALRKQSERGLGIGLEPPLVGETAEMICELTGNDRACFVNDGTEAVFSAVRLARTTTGRHKIVMFQGGYHGWFDEVMSISRKGADGRLFTLPILVVVDSPPSDVNSINILGSVAAASLSSSPETLRDNR